MVLTDGEPVVVEESPRAVTIANQIRTMSLLRPQKVAMREKDFGIWQSYSWADYFRHAQFIGLVLAELGMERGDRVSILSEDRKEWLYCDMGIVGMGGITNGIYTTDSAVQLSYLINDSGSRFLFVENDEQLDKYLEMSDDMIGLDKVIVFDRDGLRDFRDPNVMFYDDLLARGAQLQSAHPERFNEGSDRARPSEVLMLIYTSGTTGPAKGAMITHRNMLYQISAGLDFLDVYETDEQLCFLPLCHVYERLISVHFQLGAGSTVNFAESVETIFENMQEVSPHYFAAVPRLWEKIYSQVQIRRAEATPLGRWFLDRAISVGLTCVHLEESSKPIPAGLKLRRSVLDWLVFRNLRNMLGMDRMRRGNSGAAPVSPELLRWFFALGVPLIEGYGATETCGVATANTERDNNIGTVGKPMKGSEVRIGSDGEILVRGPNVFLGYWNMPDKTAETIDGDGWLHTGDVGRIGNDHRLTITGRIKDIIITMGGKNISPAEIESQLKFSPYVSDAVVIGDARRYLTCLIMIDQENVEKFAQDNQVPFNDFASLCSADAVRTLIGEQVAAANKLFARVEQIKDFRLIDVLLTPEDDELTPTMKLKRSFVERNHATLIDSMY